MSDTQTLAADHVNAGRPLADDEQVLYRSPDPARIHSYSPGIWRMPGGRLIATCDLGGPGVAELPGVKASSARGDRRWQGKVFVSDDHGQSWRHVHDFPFMHARPFTAGGRAYVLGQDGDLRIIASDDSEQWSEPVALSDGEHWHQAPCNVWHANGCVYLVMERRHERGMRGCWPVGSLAPVLLRAREDDDLLRPEAWTRSSELVFQDLHPHGSPSDLMVPFLPCAADSTVMAAPHRAMAPLGWLESNVVRIDDPAHVWHDPSGRTFHILMRAHTGCTGLACLLRARECGDEAGTGAIVVEPEQSLAGEDFHYLPLPGGQMKFHLLFDDETRLFWLLSTQATDSMTRPELLSDDRYGIPDNERRRLQLHFSRNMVDWCFAGVVCEGANERASRHYASMVIDGDDLLVLARSGSPEIRHPEEPWQDAHETNLITQHRLRDFRSLVY